MSSGVTHRIPPEQRATEQQRANEQHAWMNSLASEVPANTLTKEQKQRVWAHIKQTEPERHAFLIDPTLHLFMAATGAVPTFPRALVRAALQS